jgi:hypothetical protein
MTGCTELRLAYVSNGRGCEGQEGMTKVVQS